MSPTSLQVSFADPVAALVALASTSALALLAAAASAAGYRWYFRERIPEGVAALVGAAAVTLYLNVTASLNAVIDTGGTSALEPETALLNVTALALATLVSPAGLRLGDRTATDVVAVTGAKELEGEVGRVARAVARVTAVTLPEEVADVESYDPVEPRRKAALSGKTLLFPGRPTGAELRERLATRLKEEYGVGYVDAELTDDGSVAYLAVGARAAGVGQTLPPSTVAVAVRADPAAGATPGDAVEVWRPGVTSERVAAAELRAASDDAATLVVDEADADRLDAETAYRLVTLPASPRHDREFASLLRRADETMAVVTVAPGSALDGGSVGDVSDLGAVVVAVAVDGKSANVIPPRSRVFAAGESVYAVGRPDALRRLERAAVGPPESDVDGAQPS